MIRDPPGPFKRAARGGFDRQVINFKVLHQEDES